MTSRTKTLRGRRRVLGPCTLDDILYSWILDGRHRMRLLSKEASMVLLLTTVGRSNGKVRGCTRRRRRQLGLWSSWTGVL